MKPLNYVIMIFICGSLSGCFSASLVTIEEKGPPPWAPAHGFRAHSHYYFPDYEMYYYVPTAEFIYISGGVWIFSASLPAHLVHIDLYSCYKVGLHYKGKEVYKDISKHRTKYPKKDNKTDPEKKTEKKKVDKPEKKEEKKVDKPAKKEETPSGKNKEKKKSEGENKGKSKGSKGNGKK